MSLLTIGINHTTAPVDIRERVAFAPESIPQTLTSLLELPGVEEASLLSTCNRTEVTCWHQNAANTPWLPEWLSAQHSLEPNQLAPYLYTYDDSAAVRHTLRVACGLDSLVLGEPQILGQLKTAYQQAMDQKSLGRHLCRLYQHTFQTAKQVRTETAIGSSAVSVAFAAVSLAKQIFGDLNQQTALLIGAGETIELAARHLSSQGVAHIIVANRTVKRAEKLASQFNARAVALQRLPDVLPEADIIISSTASPLPILGKGAVERALKKRKHRPMFMVDIAVPRDIEAEVSALRDVYLYTVDDLHDVIEEGLNNRKQAAEQAEKLVDVQVGTFMGWLQSQGAVDTIRAYRSKALHTQNQVADQARRMLSQGKDMDSIINYLSHTLTNKLLHDATSALNHAARNGDETLLDAARTLFRLDVDQEKNL
ncbi:MAG TPA: glutamyl-tRNA reductase [Gammaproteobacteria bacterium]|nr:glutamyl-tRNA reductase [Gammaproteobacteria bacterium]